MTAAKVKRNTPKAKRKEKAKAEETIEKAYQRVKEKVKRVDHPAKLKSQPWVEKGVTEEAIVKARDTNGLSWRDVATNVGLANPGQARAAYTALTGRAHNQSIMTGKKARRGTGGSRKALKPEWNNESDTEEIAEAIDGHLIIVESPSGPQFEPEELNVYKILGFDEFTYTQEETDLFVSFIEGIRRKDKDDRYYIDRKQSTGHTRSIRVSRIMAVR